MRNKFISRDDFAELSDEQYASLEKEIKDEIRWHNRPIIVSGICFAITSIAAITSACCLLLYGGGKWDMILIVLNLAIMIANLIQFTFECKTHNTEKVLHRVDEITERFCGKTTKTNT